MKWIFCLLPWLLAAQTPEPFGPDYRFADGVYLSHAALLAGAPDINWSEIAGEMVQLAEDHRVQIDGYGYKSGSDRGTPYAISLDGVPYFYTRHDERRNFHEFAGLRLQGRYGTMTYDTSVHMRRLMRAYNPANGLPFREGWVERDQLKTVERIIDMETGVRHPLDRASVLAIVGEERDLAAALDRVTEEEQPRLIRALQIMNERHPLLLPLSEANR